jgi:isopenicillin-N epimerase
MADLTRRDFARLLGFGGPALLLPSAGTALEAAAAAGFDVDAGPLPPTPREPDEVFWRAVRRRFLVPPDRAFLNAANLCPTSLPVIEAHERYLRDYEMNPAPAPRAALMAQRETARRLLADALRATPEEIVITRNTSEGNNFVSSGLDFGAGDEVVVFSDNHPTNLRAWQLKGARHGFSVVTVQQVNPHPGTDYYVAAFERALSPRTRLLALTHTSSDSGDVLPVAELCALARTRGVLSLVDAAQAFGVLDIDLSQMRPDFFTGSMHKWPCGPKEKGLLYVRAEVQDRLHPSIVGLYGGAVGLSRTFEAHGQRDDASIAALVAALELQHSIGHAAIETRARQLAGRLVAGLAALPGVHFWTSPDAERSAAIVVFRPGDLDPRALGAALYERDRIVVTVRAGQDRTGLRISPHFYNTLDDIDRTVDAIGGYLRRGV